MAWGVIAADIIIPAAQIIRPAGAYRDQPNSSATTAGNFWRLTPVERRQTNFSRIELGSTMTLAGPALAAAALPAAALANTDTGGFDTNLPAAGNNRDGLPWNWGAGGAAAAAAGGWDQDDVDSVVVVCRESATAAGRPGVGNALANDRAQVANPLCELNAIVLGANTNMQCQFQAVGASTGGAASVADVLSTPRITLLWVPPQAR